MRWPGPARGKGRGWGPAVCRGGGAGAQLGHPYVARAQRDQMGQKAAFRPAQGGAASASDFGAPTLSPASTLGREEGIRSGLGMESGKCFPVGTSCPYLWLSWLSPSSVLLIRAALDGALRSTNPLTQPAPALAKPARGGEVPSGEGPTFPAGRLSPECLSRNRCQSAEGAPLRRPDLELRPRAGWPGFFPFRATRAGRDGAGRAQVPAPPGCPRGAIREGRGGACTCGPGAGARGTGSSVPRPPPRPHVGAAGRRGQCGEAPPPGPGSQ